MNAKEFVDKRPMPERMEDYLKKLNEWHAAQTWLLEDIKNLQKALATLERDEGSNQKSVPSWRNQEGSQNILNHNLLLSVLKLGVHSKLEDCQNQVGKGMPTNPLDIEARRNVVYKASQEASNTNSENQQSAQDTLRRAMDGGGVLGLHPEQPEKDEPTVVSSGPASIEQGKTSVPIRKTIYKEE